MDHLLRRKSRHGCSLLMLARGPKVGSKVESMITVVEFERRLKREKIFAFSETVIVILAAVPERTIPFFLSDFFRLGSTTVCTSIGHLKKPVFAILSFLFYVPLFFGVGKDFLKLFLAVETSVQILVTARVVIGLFGIARLSYGMQGESDRFLYVIPHDEHTKI